MVQRVAIPLAASVVVAVPMAALVARTAPQRMAQAAQADQELMGLAVAQVRLAQQQILSPLTEIPALQLRAVAVVVRAAAAAHLVQPERAAQALQEYNSMQRMEQVVAERDQAALPARHPVHQVMVAQAVVMVGAVVVRAAVQSHTGQQA